jgi:polyisoprenoid-binding protein YceI
MRLSRLLLAVVAALAIIGVIALVWFITTSGTGEASQPISAPTLEITPEATVVVEGSVGEPVLFSIVPGESSVSFALDEELMGRPTTVVGTTTDVAGQIAVNFDQPSASQLGVIRFNLRTLATDNDFRNRAIRGEILRSAQDDHEFGEFAPTSITGLQAEPVVAGQPLEFEVTGDLLLAGVTHPVTFAVTLSEVDAGRLVGEATATVDRTDWNLTIPDVPGVANVEETVDLTLAFVAVPDSAAPEATAAPDAPAAEGPVAEPVVFNITPGESTVSFELDEDLRGERVTVVGTTPDVAGQIAVNFDNPAASQVGVIRFNLRTIATDNDFRNRAIRGQILQSAQDEFEFGQFAPTSISGLPETPIEPGEPITFEMTGDLTLRDVTNPVTFAVSIAGASPESLTGEATATINRNDWGLTIPSVPGVANVEEEVLLRIQFVAAPEAGA